MTQLLQSFLEPLFLASFFFFKNVIHLQPLFTRVVQVRNRYKAENKLRDWWPWRWLQLGACNCCCSACCSKSSSVPAWPQNQLRPSCLLGAQATRGLRLSKALLNDNRFKVSVFSRTVPQTRKRLKSEKEQTLEQLRNADATILRGSLSDLDDLTRILKGFDFVVSALSYDALEQQLTLVEAAKAAGVKRFVPSEWGLDTPRYLREGKTSCCFSNEGIKILQAVYDSGMDYTILLPGLFYETTFAPLFWWDLAAGKVIIKGDPDKQFSITSEDDVARWLPDILMDPASRNSVVRLEGQRVSWNEAVQICEHVQGRKLEVMYRTLAELEAEIAAASDPWQVSMEQATVLLSEGYFTNDDSWFKRADLDKDLYRKETLQPARTLADFLAAKVAEANP